MSTPTPLHPSLNDAADTAIELLLPLVGAVLRVADEVEALETRDPVNVLEDLLPEALAFDTPRALDKLRQRGFVDLSVKTVEVEKVVEKIVEVPVERIVEKVVVQTIAPDDLTLAQVTDAAKAHGMNLVPIVAPDAGGFMTVVTPKPKRASRGKGPRAADGKFVKAAPEPEPVSAPEPAPVPVDVVPDEPWEPGSGVTVRTVRDEPKPLVKRSPDQRERLREARRALEALTRTGATSATDQHQALVDDVLARYDVDWLNGESK